MFCIIIFQERGVCFIKELIDKLYEQKSLSEKEYTMLLDNFDNSILEYSANMAREISKRHFGNGIYIRGLIEISSFCKNDCYYCGLRRSNKNAQRYRLNKDDIMSCCAEGYKTGFRTFVLQGGEDAFFTDGVLCDIVSEIRENYPDCAITLSLGERTKQSYEKLYNSGANRYLLRHESADCSHYAKLHPEELTLENRMECLKNLKETGFQTGCGFMVDSPYQKNEHLAKDLCFINEFNPQMVGIGPFLPHKDTPFRNEKKGSLKKTLLLLSLVRIAKENVLLPATTALATLDPKGRQYGILCGANVVMPNLSPTDVRKKYMLYNDKATSDEESAQGLKMLQSELLKIGYCINYDRGDYTPNK